MRDGLMEDFLLPKKIFKLIKNDYDILENPWKKLLKKAN